jgi:hypothetical protein
MPLSYLQGPHKNAGDTAISKSLASVQSEAFGLKDRRGLQRPVPFTDDSHRNDDNIDSATIDLNVVRPQNSEHQIVSIGSAAYCICVDHA